MFPLSGFLIVVVSRKKSLTCSRFSLFHSTYTLRLVGMHPVLGGRQLWRQGHTMVARRGDIGAYYDPFAEYKLLFLLSIYNGQGCLGHTMAARWRDIAGILWPFYVFKSPIPAQIVRLLSSQFTSNFTSSPFVVQLAASSER